MSPYGDHGYHSSEHHKRRRNNKKSVTRKRAFEPAIYLYDEGTPIESICEEEAGYVHLVCPGHVNNRCKHCNGRTFHSDSLVIAVDGACPDNGKTKNMVFSAAGVYVGAENELSQSYALIDRGATNQKAEIRAAIKGLETVSRVQSEWNKELDRHIGHVVIKTDSAYVHSGITDFVNNKWKKNGWKNAKNEPVANRPLWEELDMLVETLEDRGIDVFFWKVPREMNREADALANEKVTVLKWIEERLDVAYDGDMDEKYQFAMEHLDHIE